MMDIARIVVAVCDSSKFGRRSLSLIAPPSAVHRVITDRLAPKSDIDQLRKAGIEIIQAYADARHLLPETRKRLPHKREK